jgi:hypothetical protein
LTTSELRAVLGMYCLIVALWCDDNPGRLPTPSLETA